MNLNFDYWLLAISAVATSASLLIAFVFVRQLYLSTNTSKKILLPVYTLAIGSAILANHYLISIGFHGDAELNSPAFAFVGWVLSLAIGFGLLFVASKPRSKIWHFLLFGAIAGICDLMLFYSSSITLHGNEAVLFDTPLTILSTGISAALSALSALMFYWIRSLRGKYAHFTKALAAISIALSILAVHIIFESGISHQGGLLSYAGNQEIHKITGIAIGLGMICLFMSLFIFILFFEKHGTKLFNFSFLSPFKSTDMHVNAMLDNLTKLPNRKAFQLQLKSAATHSERAGTTFALAYIDLDHFKPINDRYGHHIGDIVLTTVATRLIKAVRNCDFVARIGGDEFIAIIEEIKSDEDIIPIVERILDSIKESFSAEDYHIEISCSVGIAIYPKDGDIDRLLICADSAMYKAKEHGKNRFRFYDADIESASDQMLSMQRDLRMAMANNEFQLEFQPKLDCKTLAIKGAESLIRWHHPDKGVLLPNVFLPVAEHFGLISQINDWVAEECCHTIFRAKQLGINLNLSINLPQQQFRNIDLVEDITNLLQFYDIDANDLTFEIKETTAVTDQTQFKLLISKFNAAGIKVTLDDFGLHPISLKYLQDLNVKELKLDKVFVSVINENKSSRALITGVIQLAHALGLKVIAEGVENETQWQALIELGCDQMQGFLFSKPVPEEKLFALYKQLENKQMQIDFESSGQLLVSDYQEKIT